MPQEEQDVCGFSDFVKNILIFTDLMSLGLLLFFFCFVLSNALCILAYQGYTGVNMLHPLAPLVLSCWNDHFFQSLWTFYSFQAAWNILVSHKMSVSTPSRISSAGWSSVPWKLILAFALHFALLLVVHRAAGGVGIRTGIPYVLQHHDMCWSALGSSSATVLDFSWLYHTAPVCLWWGL